MAADSESSFRFRANVLRLLEERGATITDIANALSMSRPSLSRALHGHDDFTFDRAERIARYFSLELRDLLQPVKKLRQPA